VPPLPLTPDGLADLVERTLVEGAGGWSLGVCGALAEYAPLPGERAAVRRAGRTVEAIAAGGGLRLTISDDTVAYATGRDGADVTLAVPRPGRPAPAPGVTLRPCDPDALRPADASAVLADLAVGHAAAAFCIRTSDSDLVAALAGLAGRTWRDVLDALGHRLVAASPARVIIGPLGRIEVWNPIPADAGVSPEGCHTHLLPALLETGRESAEAEELPPQLLAAGNWTNPGWGSRFTLVKSPPT